MNADLILVPMLAMVLLTAIVWLRSLVVRVGEMRARRVPPRELSTRAAAAKVLRNTTASDHFMNLFEMPVLFYVLVMLLWGMDLVDGAQLTLAVVFVALRYVHSVVHLTYNRVMHRFFFYLASSLALWAMWGWFAVQLWQRLCVG